MTACLAFSTPFLTRLLLYLGKVCTISDESCLIVGMAASAMSRVMIVVVSYAFTRVNDFAILSMSRSFCFDNFTILFVYCYT